MEHVFEKRKHQKKNGHKIPQKFFKKKNFALLPSPRSRSFDVKEVSSVAAGLGFSMFEGVQGVVALALVHVTYRASVALGRKCSEEKRKRSGTKSEERVWCERDVMKMKEIRVERGLNGVFQNY